MPQYTLEQVYRMLMSGTFEMWYNTTMLDYIEGDENSFSKEQIMDELEVLLN